MSTIYDQSARYVLVTTLVTTQTMDTLDMRSSSTIQGWAGFLRLHVAVYKCMLQEAADDGEA